VDNDNNNDDDSYDDDDNNNSFDDDDDDTTYALYYHRHHISFIHLLTHSLNDILIYSKRSICPLSSVNALVRIVRANMYYR
jgi:hypothetical protein